MNTSIDILWYGRGGQGAFSAAKLLGASYAFGADGNHALAFPSFGPERRGAPVRAYTKLSSAPVNNRSAVTVPDYAICLDRTLLQDFAGLQIKEGGFVLTTTSKIEEFATEYIGRPIVNTALLALLCAQTGMLSAADIERGITQTLPVKIQERNKQLTYAAFEHARDLLEGALSEPSESPEKERGQHSFGQQTQHNPDLGFEYMNLYSADGFDGPQRVYGAPSERGSK